MPDNQGVRLAAQIIGISVRTAPKSGGIDDVACKIIEGPGQKKLSAEVRALGKKLAAKKNSQIKKAIELDWYSDAAAVARSDCVILIGVKGKKPLGLNCGGCGFKDCSQFEKAKIPNLALISGPFCVFKLWDLGIASSSAASAARGLGVDNRIIFKVGVAALRLRMLAGYNPVLGLPLSASGKNIYFDRWEKLEAKKIIMEAKWMKY